MIGISLKYSVTYSSTVGGAPNKLYVSPIPNDIGDEMEANTNDKATAI